MENIFKKCRIGPLPWTDFIGVADDCSDDETEIAEPPQKIAREDCKFKDDHLMAFRNHGLAWPPSLPPTLRRVCRGLGQRQTELIFFLDHTTEAGPDPNYVDINMSLGYLMGIVDVVGSGFFKTRFPNLTGQTTIYMRFMHHGVVHHKILSGTELMQVIGWDRLMYETGVPKGEGKLLTSLAGNAFSAFSIGIIALAARIASQVPATLSLDSVDLASQDSVLSGCETPQRMGEGDGDDNDFDD